MRVRRHLWACGNGHFGCYRRDPALRRSPLRGLLGETFRGGSRASIAGGIDGEHRRRAKSDEVALDPSARASGVAALIFLGAHNDTFARVLVKCRLYKYAPDPRSVGASETILPLRQLPGLSLDAIGSTQTGDLRSIDHRKMR
jgi:hypothetical protein